MKLIDTHAHLQFKAYDEDRDIVVKRNSDELAAIINVGATLDSSEGAVKLSEKTDNFYSSVGIHPHHSEQWNQETLDKLTKLAGEEKVVAIGEIGLDLHQYTDYPKPRLEDQTKMLHDQIGLAVEKNLPVIFHCRDAYEELLGEIAQYKGKIRGVMHCFIGSLDQAEKFLSFGLYLSFTGNITYKNNDSIREVAKNTPNDKILIETDSPYLPPEPHRGRRNEPIYVKMVASKIAELKNLSLEEVAAATSDNAKTLFKINYVH